MPRKSLPSYRLHKPSGQARVILNGKHVYLGKYKSDESMKKYARLIAELALPAEIGPTQVDADTLKPTLLVSEMIVHYVKFAERYYSFEGKPTKEFQGMLDAVAPLNELYAETFVGEFGPTKLKALQAHLVSLGLCRTEVNRRIGRIKRVFKWAVSEELVDPRVLEGLRSVNGLRYGRTDAKEVDPVEPVAECWVEQTIPFVSPPVAAMIRLQLLTGMRPGEVLAMRPCDIDRSGETWIYEPHRHKNRWRGHRRLVPLGPQAQETIRPFLNRDDSEYLFSPAEAETWRNEQRAKERDRKTPVYPCELRNRSRRKKLAAQKRRSRPLGKCYTTDSYRQAVTYGIDKANKKRQDQEGDHPEIPHWFPNQLRHTFATRIRKLHGVEAAQVGLGHARTNIVDIYAEKNLEMIIDIAKKAG